MEICRSPSLGRSTTARSARPIRRWISCVRPEGWPTVASRRVRSVVARGSMPYSAVTQPRPWPLSQGGMRSSRLAVQWTWVLPNLIRQEPSACIDTARSIETRRKLIGLALGGTHGALRSLAEEFVGRTLKRSCPHWKHFGPAFARRAKRIRRRGPTCSAARPNLPVAGERERPEGKTSGKQRRVGKGQWEGPMGRANGKGQ